MVELGLAVTSALSGDGWYMSACVGTDQEGSQNFLAVYTTQEELHLVPVEHVKQRIDAAGAAFFCNQETVNSGMLAMLALSQVESPGSLLCRSKAAIKEAATAAAMAAVTAAAAVAAAEVTAEGAPPAAASAARQHWRQHWVCGALSNKAAADRHQ